MSQQASWRRKATAGKSWALSVLAAAVAIPPAFLGIVRHGPTAHRAHIRHRHDRRSALLDIYLGRLRRRYHEAHYQEHKTDDEQNRREEAQCQSYPGIDDRQHPSEE